MIADGKAEAVLKIVANALKKYPDEKQRQVFVPMIRGDCYVALNKPVLAEKYYLEAITLFEESKRMDSYYNIACKSLAEFYVGQKALRQGRSLSAKNI